jgi:hypothetical protein
MRSPPLLPLTRPPADLSPRGEVKETILLPRPTGERVGVRGLIRWCSPRSLRFLATIESLRGIRGILADATSHPDPETPRGANEELRKRMTPNRKYTEKTDQPALTHHFDMATAYQRCRSFRRLVSAFGLLAASLGITLEQWPPSEWVGP